MTKKIEDAVSDSPDQPGPLSDVEEAAALYLAGALTDAECEAFESLIEKRDDAASRAMQLLIPQAEALLSAIKPVPPSTRVRDAVMSMAQKETLNRAYVQRAAAALWKPLGVPGVSYRMLFVDRDRGTQTFMLRLEPGARIPFHDHGDAEECTILEGELTTLGTTLHSGDFFRAPQGSGHAESYSRTGCLLLVTSGIDEEFVADSERSTP